MLSQWVTYDQRQYRITSRVNTILDLLTKLTSISSTIKANSHISTTVESGKEDIRRLNPQKEQVADKVYNS